MATAWMRAPNTATASHRSVIARRAYQAGREHHERERAGDQWVDDPGHVDRFGTWAMKTKMARALTKPT
jgi:hypothetical protein